MFKKILPLIIVSLIFASAAAAQEPATTKDPSAGVATKKRSPIFRPTKDQIAQVQVILKNKGLYDGDSPGVYNPETRTGIKGFQKSNGLKQTGTLNRATLEKFGVELTESQKQMPVSPNSFATDEKSTGKGTSSKSGNAPKRAPIFRANSDQIRAAQRLLKVRGLYEGGETGKLSDETRAGLRKFQDSVDIKVTGTLNAITLEKMGIPLTDKQKANAASATAIKN